MQIPLQMDVDHCLCGVYHCKCCCLVFSTIL